MAQASPAGSQRSMVQQHKAGIRLVWTRNAYFFDLVAGEIADGVPANHATRSAKLRASVAGRGFGDRELSRRLFAQIEFSA